MSRRISTAPGKAFIWLIAAAVALLVEGMLLQVPNIGEGHAPESSARVAAVAAVGEPESADPLRSCRALDRCGGTGDEDFALGVTQRHVAH